MFNGFKNVSIACKKIILILSEKHRKQCLGLVLFIIVGSFFEMAGVSVIVPLIQVILSPNSILENPKMRGILHIFKITDAKGVVLFIGVGTIILYLLKNLYMTFLSWKRVTFATKVQQELSINVMKAYMSKGYAFFLTTNTGDVQRAIQNDTEGVYQVLLQGMRLITELFSILCICILIIIIDWKMAICVMLFAFLGFAIVALTCRRYLKKIGKQYQFYNGLVNSSLIQTIQGIKEITIMQCRDFFVEKYEKSLGKRQKIVAGQVVAAESPAYLIEAICVMGMLSIVSVSALQNTNMTDFVSSLGAFAIAAFRILPSMGKITNYLNNFMFYYPSVDSVYDSIQILQKHESEEACFDTSNIRKLKFEDKLELENITWHYPNSDKEVLNDLNLRISKGMSIGLVGASGAGKTTVADIILGLFRPQKGQVLLDGQNIGVYSKQRYRMIGYVPQNIFLIDDTIRNNIAFGVIDSDIDDKKVWIALEQAQLKEFVQGLPEGLDTLLGDRGVRFSGGQRQRLAIARALYNDPDILVLDEATSALDNETESAVMEAIDMLHNKKTLIIVAHRLSTIQNCDLIYEIVDGKAIRKEI